MNYDEFIKRFKDGEIGLQISDDPDFAAICEMMESEGWGISGDGYENISINQWAIGVLPDYQYLVPSRLYAHKVTARSVMSREKVKLAGEICLNACEDLVKEALMLIV